MKALIFDKSKYTWENSKGFDLMDVPKPEIEKDDEVIIKVHYAGVCGSDKGIWYRTAFRDQILGSLQDGSTSPGSATLSRPGEGRERSKTYRIIGHEFFGEIAELGSKAGRQYKLKKGDFVSCESHVVCNQCFQCKLGQKHVCTNEKILGISHDGGFAEYIKVPGHIVWKTDTSKIRPEIAAVQEPFGNAVHAASKVDLKGKTIAILGLGPIGLFLLLVARGMGVKNIIGVEPNPVAIEMARKLGIDYVIPLKPGSTSPGSATLSPASFSLGEAGRPGEGRERSNYGHNPKVTDQIMKITSGLGVDVAFEMAGFNDSLNNAIFSTRRGGDVILFGIKSGDFILEDYNRLIIRGLTLHAVVGRQIWQTWEITKKLLENSGNKIQEQIYKIILNEGRKTILPIEDYSKEKFEKMITEHPKILLQF